MSLFSDEYAETMHSDSGAYEESLLKHVYPSRVLDRTEKTTVFDIGFGLGYNALALSIEWVKHKSGVSLEIVSFEKDHSYGGLLDTIRFGDERDEMYEHIQCAYHTGHSEFQNVFLTVNFGDARTLAASAAEKYTADAVFQDPYSPAKNPELWTLDYFIMLASCMSKEAVLTTYSAAPQVRRALIEAGLFLAKGPSVGRKKEGTLASKKQFEENRFTPDDTAELLSNIKSTVYRDELLTAAREEILSRRIESMKEYRTTRGL